MKQAVTAGEGSFKLCVFSGEGPLTFSDMLLVRGQVHDFFPLLLLAHLADSFCFAGVDVGPFLLILVISRIVRDYSHVTT
jgi:hypothetical protein